MGQPMEHNLRQCLIASRLGDRRARRQRSEGVYYAGIMAWVGCHVDAYEQAKWFGDEIALKGDARQVDFQQRDGHGVHPRARRRASRSAPGEDRHRLHRRRDEGRRVDAREPLAGPSTASPSGWGSATTSARASGRRSSGGTARGSRRCARGEEALLTSRLVNLADVVEVFYQVGGVEAAVAVARERSGTQFDPGLVDALLRRRRTCSANSTTRELERSSSRSRRSPNRSPTPTSTRALEAVADFTDVKSPYTIGHSAGDRRPRLRRRRRRSGSRRRRQRDVRRAGLLHDIGRLGVPNSVWDKQAPLTLSEMERVRMHPYLTERTLAPSPGLRPLGALAIQHHERLDGSGLPEGAEGRRHHAGGTGAGCSGRLPGEDRAVDRTAAAATATEAADSSCGPRPRRRPRRRRGGGRAPRRRPSRARRRSESVAGLTARELEVLRLAGPGVLEQADRPRARHQPEDDGQPRRAHLHEARRRQPGAGEPLRRPARPARLEPASAPPGLPKSASSPSMPYITHGPSPRPTRRVPAGRPRPRRGRRRARCRRPCGCAASPR